MQKQVLLRIRPDIEREIKEKLN